MWGIGNSQCKDRDGGEVLQVGGFVSHIVTLRGMRPSPRHLFCDGVIPGSVVTLNTSNKWYNNKQEIYIFSSTCKKVIHILKVTKGPYFAY